MRSAETESPDNPRTSFAARSGGFPQRLFQKPQRSPERVLLGRVLLLLTLVGAIFTVFWLDREGLRDQLDGHVSAADVAYFTAITITTVGYGDIVPVSDRARLLDAALVTPLRLLAWLVFLGTTYELVAHRWMESRRMEKMQKALKDHLIICGYGLSGQVAAMESVERGIAPERIVVMDRDPARLTLAADAGFFGLLGDPTHEKDLVDAGVDRAQAVLVCVGRDDTAVLSVLTIRQLSPGVRIVCNVAEGENIKVIKQAGANAVVAPSLVGGFLMADSVETSYIAEYVGDLMQSAGRVRLRQRPASGAEVGLTLRQVERGLGVRLIRGDERIGFWEGERARIRAGDILLLIEPEDSAQEALKGV